MKAKFDNSIDCRHSFCCGKHTALWVAFWRCRPRLCLQKLRILRLL